MSNALVFVVSDPHTNSTIGLCPPYVPLDDGGAYHASLAQKWLWRCWQEFWRWGRRLIEKRVPARVIVVFGGDLSDGDHHSTSQIITRNPTTMLRLAVDAMEPGLAVADDVYVIRGTPSHTGKSAHLEEKIAEDISATPQDEATWSHWHLRLEVEGVYLDIAHHGRMGSRPWTRPNAVNRLASHVLMENTDAGWRIPDIVIRSHRHKHADSGDNYKRIRAIHTPAWQLATEFVRRVAPEDADLADIGGLCIECENGKYHVYKRRFDAREPEVIVA